MLDNKEKNVLLIAGTSDAKELAVRIKENLKFARLTVSLAGATNNPDHPKSDSVLVGKIKSQDDLENIILGKNITLIIDASHPFAEVIKIYAKAACNKLNVPYVRYARTPWDIDKNWIKVESAENACSIIKSGARVALLCGRKFLNCFLPRKDLFFVARFVDKQPNDYGLIKENFKIIYSKPPFTTSQEVEFLEKHHFNYLVCKNSGGQHGKAKLEAAKQLNTKVVIISPRSLHEEDDDITFRSYENCIQWMINFYKSIY